VLLVATASALVLYLVLERAGASSVPLALLRSGAWGAVGILLVNPSCHRAVADRADVLLDGSQSMSDAAGDARWRAAVDSAQAAAGNGGRILVFGGEPRVFGADVRPDAPTSRLLPALREAAARGGRIVVVTDGLVDDAAAIPEDLRRAARVVIVPRADRIDAGIAALAIPATLRAGDTAIATVDIAAAGTSATDTVTLELLEQGRRVANLRVPLGAGGSVRREVLFVPAVAGGAGGVRRYEGRLSGLARDGEPRDDRRESASSVSQASAIVLLSDAPDWDFRWLTQSLTATSGVPVRAYVRLGAAGWRSAHTMRPASETVVRQEAANAALVVAHGTSDGVEAAARLAKRGVWQWVTVPRTGTAGASGDWYVARPEFASPVSDALAGVPVESLPPLELTLDVRGDSVAWTGLVAQLDRRGRSRPVVEGMVVGARRSVLLGASGLWRWASRGGVAAEGYRAVTASLTDWLLEDRAGAPPSLIALRDSLATAGTEFLPSPLSLAAQPGLSVTTAGESEPLRFSVWMYAAALGALVMEWVIRRRRGLR
jgi:hypothetical protein